MPFYMPSEEGIFSFLFRSEGTPSQMPYLFNFEGMDRMEF
jgi:hypothetical protein